MDAAAVQLIVSDLYTGAQGTTSAHRVYWDRGAAKYLGSVANGGSSTVYARANMRAKNYGTKDATSCEAKANHAVIMALNAGAASTTVAARTVQYNNIITQIKVIYSQATLRFAKLIDDDMTAGTDHKEHQAEGYASWRVIAPMVGMVADNTNGGILIEGLFNPARQPIGHDHYCLVKAVLDKQMLPAADMGTLEGTLPDCKGTMVPDDVYAFLSAQLNDGPAPSVPTCSPTVISAGIGCGFYMEADGTLTKTVVAQATCRCTFINFRSKKLTAIAPDAFVGLTSLTSLDLSFNKLTVPPTLTGLTSLENMDLSFNKLTVPPTLTGLTSLRFLRLSSRIACITCGSLPVDSNVTVGDEYGDEIACKTDCASAAPPSIESISAETKAMIPVELTQKLRQTQTPFGDRFGHSMSMSGDMVAMFGGLHEAPRSKGDINIFELSADRVWTQTARIPLLDDEVSSYNGFHELALSLSGNTLAVGANNAVVIFARNGNEWTRQVEIKTLGDASETMFTLDGDTLVMANRSSISAHRRNANGVWGDEARIELPRATTSSSYSSTRNIVTLSGNTLVVSDIAQNTCQILIFERNGAGVWIHQVDVGSFIKQACPDDIRGSGLSLNGDTLAVSGGYDRDKYTYVFARDAVGLWTLEANLTHVDTVISDWFGYAVSLHGDVLAISADGDDDKGLNAGAVYMYTRANKIWTKSAKLLATDGAAGDRFGYALALGERSLIIGAPSVSDQGIDSGAAYVYTTTPKLAPVYVDDAPGTTPKNVTGLTSPPPGVRSGPGPALSATDNLDATKAEAEKTRKEADEKKQVAATKKALADDKKKLADSNKKIADDARNAIVAKISDKKLAVEVRVVAAAAAAGGNLKTFSASITASDATAACAQMCTAAKVNPLVNAESQTLKPEPVNA